MVEIIKTQLEKSLKEYLDADFYFKKYSSKESIESVKKEIASESLEMEGNENISNLYFEKLGWLSAMENDVFALKTRLYHTYEAYKNIVEIPQEIKLKIENELQDFTMRLVYDVKSGERKIVDQDLYNMIKGQFAGVLKEHLI